MGTIQHKISQSLLAWTCRLKRDASETESLFSLSHPSINPHAIARTYTWPFKHIVIDDVFVPQIAERIHKHFTTLLANRDSSFEFRSLYKIYGRAIDETELSEIGILFDPTYKQYLERVFARALTDHTVVFMHNNVLGTEDKFVHTDHSPVFFSKAPGKGRLYNPNPKHVSSNLIEQLTGPVPEDSIIEGRAITAIAYFSPDWKSGKGGETGIFARIGGKMVCVAAIEPRFNRLLLFENLPHSFHNYMASSLPNRNSIIQWLHVSNDSPSS